jgi:hypothetical protein
MADDVPAMALAIAVGVAVWMTGFAVVVGLCMAAARGDAEEGDAPHPSPRGVAPRRPACAPLLMPARARARAARRGSVT